MESFLFYIGKVALGAGALYLLYMALFQHQKHFVFNRIYLPVSLALSFLIPLITFTRIKYIQPSMVNAANSFAYLPETAVASEQAFALQWFHYLLGIYLLGIVVFTVHLLLGHLKAIKIIRFSYLKELFGAEVNLTKKDVHPFSFFKRIVVSEKTLDNPNLEVIVNHEMVHVRENHTLDILFAEILFLFQWFNPFAWLLKAAIRDNLEYLTDDQITKNNNAEAYQMAMVGLAHKKGVAPFLTALNGSQLKNRIIMMKKKTENRYSLLKQLVVLPMLAILVMGLSNKEVKTEFVQAKKNVQIIVDGVVIPQDHPDLKNIDFSEGIDGAEITKALGIEDNVVSNGIDIKENGEPSVFFIRTSDYVEGTNADFDQLTAETTISEITVKGKITNDKGEPIPAVAVLIEGSTTGTLSDMQGNYEIRVANKDAVLVFNMLGYEFKKVPVNKEKINVVLTRSDIDSQQSAYGVAVSPKLKVSGKVTNEKGEPIVAAAVLVKGSNVGTITDLSGNYEIKTDANQTLVFSMIGYQAKEVKINGEKAINVSLIADGTGSDDEIKIIGYGKKKDVTIDVHSLKITNEDGEAPLYILDGKEIGKVEEISAEELESISVLKDENATALYGEKGKNGVVIFTTKERVKNEMHNALVIKDGKKYDGEVSDIDAESIESINILKGESAIEKYGPAAKDGAIVIKSKNAAKIEGAPLVYVDGIKYEGEMDDIKPDDIESISVLKDATAVVRFGAEAKDGVILITTKSAEITSVIELRKFIAERIKYPLDLRNANQEGVSKVYVELSENGTISNVGTEKIDGAVQVDEVVVVAYKPTENIGSVVLGVQGKFDSEAKRVLYTLPKLKIDDLKGKTLEFTVKFMLQ
ncbi:carboxypeptidase-like regulatory domain-containing protein [uncultured Draconibacterium sp.]|uniref:carboxypeptidase-like regulatory domain-containing protein n=1 Tax=uncultured Draconibacterium sp. TaxID=1573823 RepID=UPI0025F18E84|nr:carboxypeptidase-like regulatory domain-containing protein [uncultured Draconibacterium sp.]